MKTAVAFLVLFFTTFSVFAKTVQCTTADHQASAQLNLGGLLQTTVDVQTPKGDFKMDCIPPLTDKAFLCDIGPHQPGGAIDLSDANNIQFYFFYNEDATTADFTMSCQ